MEGVAEVSHKWSFLNCGYTRLKGPRIQAGFPQVDAETAWICSSILKEADRQGAICKRKTGRRKASVQRGWT